MWRRTPKPWAQGEEKLLGKGLKEVSGPRTGTEDFDGETPGQDRGTGGEDGTMTTGVGGW